VTLFVLNWDVSDLGDEDFLAYVVKFSGFEDAVGLARTIEYQMPSPVLMVGNLKKISGVDYPYTDTGWPIMSAKMRGILQDFKGCHIRCYPVRIIDDTLDNPSVYFDSVDDPKHVLTNFSAVQFLDRVHSFDWENSVYTRSEYVPDLVSELHKLVVKEAPNGFPPIFRLAAYPNLILITEETKTALEKAQIRGTEYVLASEYPSRPI
jgi:hypothetical protein